MKKYKVLEQYLHDERVFLIQEEETGEKHLVDLFTDGAFEGWTNEDKSEQTWRKWLHDKFVGKTLEIEYLTPWISFSGGKQRIIE